jgi:hypothetical protein
VATVRIDGHSVTPLRRKFRRIIRRWNGERLLAVRAAHPESVDFQSAQMLAQGGEVNILAAELELRSEILANRTGAHY